MNGQLSGQRAVVTGAASGLGREIAARYGEEGACVAMLDVDADRLADAAAAVEAETLTIECDVREAASVDAAVERTVEAWDGIDVVVNNAGVVLRQSLAETSDEDLDRVLDVNLAGILRVARATVPALRDSRGTLINMSSVTAAEGTPRRSVYSASNGGISSLTYQLAVELGPDVRVNAIAPGTIKTPLSEDKLDDEDYVARKRSKVPLDRLGTPADVAGPAVFLASADANYVNGHVLAVDGGRIHS